MERGTCFRRLTATILAFALFNSVCTPVVAVPAKQAASQGQAQSQKSRADEFKMRVESELVLVNATVRDKHGQPVTDLRQSDFTILEDGKPQKISSFDFENLETAPLSAAGGPSQTTVEGRPTAPSKPLLTRKDAEEALSNKRVIVLFFDLGSMSPDETQRAVDAAKKYVQKKMTAADMIAIISLGSSLRLDQDFTNDSARLMRVLNRFTLSEGQGYDNGSTGDADGIEESGNAYTPDETEYNQFNTDRKLQALQSISQVLSHFNQKKSIIYFSSGMTQTGVENEIALRAAVNAAIRANVAIYTLDARGLEAMPPGGSAQTASLRGQAMYSGNAIQSALDSNFASQETLTTLAADTGGKAFLDSNDLGEVFDRVRRDTTAYYVLGYHSNNPLHDGHYRHIQVKVNRPGLNLEFRKGYYAPKDFQHFNDEDKEQQMAEELASDLPNTDLAIYMAASYFRLDDRRFYVPVSLVVPGSQIPFTKGGDKDKASLDIIGEVLDELKRPVGSMRETVKLTLDGSQEVRRKNVQYSTAFILTSGKYRLKFVVRENQSGRMGSFESEFVVPDIKKAPLKLSSVVLASQRQPSTKKTQNPLVRDGNELVPNIAHSFTHDQHLYLFYEVYEPARDKSAEPAANSKDKPTPAKDAVHLLTSIEFFSGKVKAYETPLVEARQLNAPERKAVVFQFDVPLGQLKPGLYTCQVNVIDDASGTFSFPRLPVLVRDKPASPVISTAGGTQ